ncbi:MAG TPA: 3-phosphoserine/phosphohydroxythreonine transaminase [Thermoanaerobaculia bacterium]|nr:3-phosphoserine/phosphohydroxythreonine transaminase [Thermoanaerobaculia bacterium]
MSYHRVHNFGAGPAALPLAVLEEIRDELLDFRGSGASILETGHRSARYSEVHEGAIDLLRELIGGAALGDGYEVLFMGGGARTQFGLVPWNLMPPGGSADYLVTGHWAEMAAAEGAKRGRARVAWSSADSGHDRVPEAGELGPDRLDPPLGEGAAYVHYTSNNTIFGTQLESPPDPGPAPLVCDMSSDALSRPLDLVRHGLVYAGAQKNLGPAGVTVVIVRRDLLARSPPELPDTLSYARMAAARSLLNTPPVFAIYTLGLVLRQLRDRGGLPAAARRNEEKARRLYRAIDGSGGFYSGHARLDSRSRMNVTFRLPSAELEARFLAEAAAAGLTGLKGHRSVGGVRASLYNAVELESVGALVDFMQEFARRSG